jgi:hypothetical protein
MASFWRDPTWSKQKKSLKENSWFGEPKCKLRSKVVILFFFFSIKLFYPCSNYVRMENMLWIVDIVASPPFLTNFRIDMVGFVDLHKVIVRKSAF